MRLHAIYLLPKRYSMEYMQTCGQFIRMIVFYIYMDTMNCCAQNMMVTLYRVEHLGKLSHEPYVAARLTTGIGHVYTLPHERPGVTCVSKRIAEAAAFTVPIWMTQMPDKSVPTFHTLRPVTAAEAPNGTLMTMPDALTGRCIYPVSGGYAHEYITNRMHVATLILDCDLCLPECVIIDETQLYIDMVKLVDGVLAGCEGIFSGRTIVTRRGRVNARSIWR